MKLTNNRIITYILLLAVGAGMSCKQTDWEKLTRPEVNPPTVYFASSSQTVEEGADKKVKIEFKLDRGPHEDVVIPYKIGVMEKSAPQTDSATDYSDSNGAVLPLSGFITIRRGRTSVFLEIKITDDSRHEIEEKLYIDIIRGDWGENLILGNGSEAQPTRQVVTIIDDDHLRFQVAKRRLRNG